MWSAACFYIVPKLRMAVIVFTNYKEKRIEYVTETICGPQSAKNVLPLILKDKMSIDLYLYY